MNTAQMRKIELRNAAIGLFSNLTTLEDGADVDRRPAGKHGKVGSKSIDDRRLRRVLFRDSSPMRVLRAYLRGESLTDDFLSKLEKAMNLRCTVVEFKGGVPLKGAAVRSYFYVVVPPGRSTAEALVRYASCLIQEPSLIQPIGVCPKCDGVFLKMKLNQRFCSSTCKSAVWNRERLKDDPSYFADKMRGYRKFRKRRRLKGGRPR